jgi:penicillin-binding protein 2
MAEKSRANVFTRRAALLAGGKLLLLAGLGGRLYSLQVLEGDRYRLMAEDNRVNVRLLPPPRGYIVDRYGEPLAVNTLNYQLNLRPDLAGDIEATLDALSRVIVVSPEERKRVLRKIKKSRRKFLPVTVRQELAWEEVSRIEVNSPDREGPARQGGNQGTRGQQSRTRDRGSLRPAGRAGTGSRYRNDPGCGIAAIHHGQAGRPARRRRGRHGG